MFEIAHAVILGIVEGITEFLPISSTAHLTIASELLGLAQNNYTKTFEIAIQSGAILAVVALYYKKLADWQVLKRIFIAFIPTGLIGLILYHFIKNHLLGNMNVILWALALGGIFLIGFERWYQKKGAATGVAMGATGSEVSGADSQEIRTASVKTLLAIGLFQSIAMIPGVSRSGATIIGGMWLGLSRVAIVEFSFLLAVPTMLAATSLDLLKNYHAFSSAEISTLLVGLAASFITALLSITFLLKYVRNHSFAVFGVYRILLVLLIIGLLR